MSEQQSKQVNVTGGNWLDIVQRQVTSLRFGVVQITVHESKVVQVERTERVRFDKPLTDPK